MKGKSAFPKKLRLRKSRDFIKLQGRAKKLYSKHFIFLIASSLINSSRLGITVTTKIDKRAVARNRIKRRIRELFRLNRNFFKENFDINIIARKNAAEISFEETKREFLGVLSYNKLLKK